ncbi:hypothetical protein RHGRI_025216 [Rhododendron griersonianum]|uniref:Kinesin motor domain-containing protein n=1 Tax=Rhododendron griersonianum TaxID=479676 RepID=A0AAV6JA45_9ERIC|nr:hypothetical protein RHGRI_025216 [Rhododendron griersonianum]KAG5538052.1 hypothetical protein RHGRI_025216 [Rhododendron griersonianum]
MEKVVGHSTSTKFLGLLQSKTGAKDLTEQSQGINYRALSDLFLLTEQRKNTFQYDVSVQMIEIYNEQVRDLLDKLKKWEVTNGEMENENCLAWRN